MKALVTTKIRQNLSQGGSVEYELASIYERVLAHIIDLFIQGILVLIGILLFFFIIKTYLWGEEGFLLIWLFCCFWLYPVIGEVKFRGQTFGKKIAGIQVIRVNSYPLSWGTSALRNFLRITEYFPFFGFIPTGLVGMLAMAMSSKGQRLGDMVAGTIIVRKKKQTSLTKNIQQNYLQRIFLGRLKQIEDRNIGIQPIPVREELSRKEKEILVSFAQRWSFLTPNYRRELAGKLSELSGGANDDGVLRLIGMGLWLQGINEAQIK